MLSTGLVMVLVLVVGAALFAAFGIRLDGWLGVLLGGLGVAYCYLATPSLSLLPVFFVSCILILYGALSVAARRWRKPTQ